MGSIRLELSDVREKSVATLEDAREVAGSIVKAINPLSIVLFGSVARDATGADLDFLIVTEDKADPSLNADLLVHKCLKKYHKKFAVAIAIRIVKDSRTALSKR